jgi:hypothetical protein
LDCTNNLFSFIWVFLLTQEQKINNISYHPRAIRKDMGDRRKDIRRQQVQGRACQDPDGIHPILC